MTSTKKYGLIALMLSFALSITNAQDATITELEVNAKKSTGSINPDMYGIFFEDINFGADGGLYAELIKNRSFEFPQTLMGWKTFGNVEVKTEEAPFEKNPHYVRLSPANHREKHTGLENEGFRGIGIKKDAEYRFSVWGRLTGGETGKIRVELVNNQNNPCAGKEITIDSKEWKKYEGIIKSSETDPHAILRIFLTSQATIDLEHISLFPVDTWKGRKNGLRKDLAQALYDLRPGVFRFPGGCIVEGTNIETRYNWKNSVGPVENRPLNENRWHYTFPHRFFPDYFQTYGMGFYELFELAEEIGAAPLPVVNCGLACQFQNQSEKAHIAVSDLDPYIQDALDLIEFANGDANTTWGKVRAEMGHPASFNLKYLAVGNEQWGKEYPERLAPFVSAIRKKYPDIQIIGSAGPYAGGDLNNYLWPEMTRLKVDLVDEHYYMAPEWFLKNANRYDNYSRKGPKVFAGEYAAHHKTRKNNFESALAEASFMTGLERNADVVRLATYAPLFAHIDAWQWAPDMIWFDNLKMFRTPNYYIQQMYATNKGTDILTLTGNDKKPIIGQEQLYASAVYDKNSSEYIFKIANQNKTKQIVRITLKGEKNLKSAGKWLTLKGELSDENTLENPTKICPTEKKFSSIKGNSIEIEIEANSFNVIKIEKE